MHLYMCMCMALLQVHLCLFFVAPHRMKLADVALMKRLHRLVPLVVVIGKSDTMTTDETRKYKEEVRRLLEKEICGPP